ncbi:MAG: hypothetical protein IPM82_10900 [Saprospiraceae bacterium]|nr:hypothetical protein [Saprospiraceae bacterium]
MKADGPPLPVPFHLQKTPQFRGAVLSHNCYSQNEFPSLSPLFAPVETAKVTAQESLENESYDTILQHRRELWHQNHRSIGAVSL